MMVSVTCGNCYLSFDTNIDDGVCELLPKLVVISTLVMVSVSCVSCYLSCDTNIGDGECELCELLLKF